MRPTRDDVRLFLDNTNGGISSMFHGGFSKKIKNFKIEGNIIADKFWFAAGSTPSTIDMTGLTLSDRAEMPFLSYRDEVLRSITFDKNFSLSHIRKVNRMFDISPNLKLSNEQVSQILKNVSFDSYSGRLFAEVGVERLDLSTFDNSRLKITEDVAESAYDHEGHVFKNLIGLNEIVFGDRFSFENYNPKGTKLSFFDTNLSGVKKVTLSGVGTGNHKFVKDWLTDVKKAQLENSDGLYRNGQFVISVEDALKSRDDKIWESGIYTLGPVLNLNKKEPTVEHKAIPSPVIYEKDETREKGQPNITVNGEPGEEVLTTTYSVDPQTGTVTPTVGKPVKVKEPTPTRVKVAAKDKVVEREIPNKIHYVKDSEKEFGTPNETQIEGHPGLEITRTVYTVNPTDGSITKKTTTTRESEPQDTVIKVGTKKSNRSFKDSDGRNVTESIDYNVDDNGVVIPTTTRTYNQKEPTEVHKAIPSPIVYEKDETREKDQPNITVNGEPGEEVITTTYSVDPQTGTITPTVGQPVRVKEPTPTKVKVAAKNKVEIYKDEEGRTVNKVTEYNVDETTGVVTLSTTITYGDKKDSTEEHKSIPSPVVYEKDETRDYGEPNQTVNGEPGDEVTITTYSVDPQTGKVTSKTADPVIKKEPTSTKVKVAGKTKVVETEIPYKTTYIEDESVDFGTPNKIQDGVPGKEKTTTTYFVDPKTGEVTSKEEKTKVSDPQNKTVKVGTKPKIEQITENGNLYELKTIYKLNKETGEVTPETTKKFIKKVQIEAKEPSVKTPPAKTALNTGVDAAANILPILSLIGLTGGIVLPNRLKKKD